VQRKLRTVARAGRNGAEQTAATNDPRTPIRGFDAFVNHVNIHSELTTIKTIPELTNQITYDLMSTNRLSTRNS
jgi:hypothetical protein